MADDHAKAFPVRVGNALLKRFPIQVEGGCQVALHAKDGVGHETEPALAGGSFGNIRRFFQLRFEEGFAERGRFLHGVVRHDAHGFLEMTEPAVLLKENRGGDGRPDEDVGIDVGSGAGAHVKHRDSDVPNKEKSGDETFREKAMKRWLAQGGDASGQHEQTNKEEADVQRVDLDEEGSEGEIDRTPDDAEDGGVADFLAGADDEESLVFVPGEQRVSLHGIEF